MPILLDIPYNLQKNIKGEAAFKEVRTILESLTKAINDARVTAIVGANRVDKGGVCILPEHKAFSIGISIYSKEKDEPYQKYGATIFPPLSTTPLSGVAGSISTRLL